MPSGPMRSSQAARVQAGRTRNPSRPWLVIAGAALPAVVVAVGRFLYGDRLVVPLVAGLVLYGALLFAPRVRAACAAAVGGGPTTWGVVLSGASGGALVGLAGVAALGGTTGSPPGGLVTALVTAGYLGLVGLEALLVLCVWRAVGAVSGSSTGQAALAAVVVTCTVMVVGSGLVGAYWLFSWVAA